MLQHRLARRNSLRSLRELRSDKAPREWSTKRAARAAGAAALLGCAQARRPRAARAFADTVVPCTGNSRGADVVPVRASGGSVAAASTALVRAANSCSRLRAEHSPRCLSGSRRAAGPRSTKAERRRRTNSTQASCNAGTGSIRAGRLPVQSTSGVRSPARRGHAVPRGARRAGSPRRQPRLAPPFFAQIKDTDPRGGV